MEKETKRILNELCEENFPEIEFKLEEDFDKWWNSLTEEQRKKESDEAERWYREK